MAVQLSNKIRIIFFLSQIIYMVSSNIRSANAWYGRRTSLLSIRRLFSLSLSSHPGVRGRYVCGGHLLHRQPPAIRGFYGEHVRRRIRDLHLCRDAEVPVWRIGNFGHVLAEKTSHDDCEFRLSFARVFVCFSQVVRKKDKGGGGGGG